MNITAQMVKELRDKTGAGMMDAKKALVEVDGDMVKAAEILRQKGIASAEKKMGRIAAEGRVESYVQQQFCPFSFQQMQYLFGAKFQRLFPYRHLLQPMLF